MINSDNCSQNGYFMQEFFGNEGEVRGIAGAGGWVGSRLRGLQRAAIPRAVPLDGLRIEPGRNGVWACRSADNRERRTPRLNRDTIAIGEKIPQIRP